MPKCSRSKCTRLSRSIRTGLCEIHAKNSDASMGFVDATLLKEHYTALQQAGMSVVAIAQASGINRSTLYRLGAWESGHAWGSGWCEMETYRRVMAIPVPEVMTESAVRVHGIGTRRRLQALAAIGYSASHVGREFGISGSAVALTMKHEYVNASTAARVKELFDRWQLTPGPSDAVRRLAKRRGYLPPLAWDEDTIDDPNAQPYDMTVVDPNAWYEDYLELKELGKSDELIAERLGYSLDTLKTKLWRRSKNATASSH